MTCFSIQKSFRIALLAGLFFAFLPLPAGAEPPKELIEQLEKEEQQKKDEAIGKVDSPIVIELFTTADCSACVFADRILYDTMKDKNVIALSCKIVDLSETHTKFETAPGADDDAPPIPQAKKQKGPMDPCVFRQWTYKSSYTATDVKVSIPNFIFNGADQVGAGDLNFFLQTLNSYHYSARNKTLEVFMRWKDKDTITIHLPEDPKARKEKESASVWIIRYKDMMVEKVSHGINTGRVLRFSNIIQDIKHIGKWHQQMRVIDIDVPAPQGGKDRGGYVVVVQEMMGQPILAAGKLVDYPHPNDIKQKKEDEARRAAEKTKRAAEAAELEKAKRKAEEDARAKAAAEKQQQAQ